MKNVKWLRPCRAAIQFITGYGEFAGTLFERGQADDPMCSCGDLQTSQHIIYDCVDYRPMRHALHDMFGDNPDLSELLSSEDAFKRFEDFSISCVAQMKASAE